MNRQRFGLSLLLGIVLLMPGLSRAQPAAPQPAPESPAAGSAMLLIENAGQWPPSTHSGQAARFQVWGGPVGTMWLAEDGIWVSRQVNKEEVDKERVDKGQVGKEEGCEGVLVSLSPCLRTPQGGVNIKLSFPGADPHPRLEPFDRRVTKVSYFLGNDPAGWRPEAPVWGGVRYVDLWPGVDLVVGAAEGTPWRFEARAGADLGAVRVQVDGADAVDVEDGVLRLSAEAGEIGLPLMAADFGYTVNGRAVDGWEAELAAGGVEVEGLVQADNPADLLYSTYLGGSGPYADGAGAIAVDASGSAYVTGDTGSTDFPATPGAYDPSSNGGWYDGYVVKFNPTGSALDYATFLGGSGCCDSGNAIAVDGMGNAYVMGTTDSADFPTTSGAFDRTFNGGPTDSFVVKLNATGSILAYASYLGASGDDSGFAIAVDEVNSAYLLGQTVSGDFPVTPGAFDSSFNGVLDSFVAKLNPAGGALEYGTYLGGNGGDEGRALAVDKAGNTYVAGQTFSADFPATPGAFDSSFNGGPFGGGDAFAVKLNAEGSALVFSSFLGGSSGNDSAGGIAVDETGNAFVIGSTPSSDFPVTPGAFDPDFNGLLDAFVVKFNPEGSDLTYASFFGGAAIDSGSSVAVDRAGNAYISGSTGSSDFPVTAGAFDASHNGGEDAFILKLSASGSALQYATFLGGSGNEGGGVVLGGTGMAYIAGGTDSSDFPTTPGAFDPSYNGSNGDGFVAKLDMGDQTPIPLWLPLVRR